MLDKGLVHIITGDGKGKTSASVGLAVRAVGAGLKVLFVQFMKTDDSSEISMLNKIGVDVCHPQKEIKFFSQMTEKEKKESEKNCLMCYNDMKRTLQGDVYNVIVLDEVFYLNAFGYISINELIDLMLEKSPKAELVLTGRDAPTEIFEYADYISNIVSVKHPYDNGIPARKGIEF